jgi:hypothetical protein
LVVLAQVHKVLLSLARAPSSSIAIDKLLF